MTTQHTPESLAKMPMVTAEQITMFRDAAIQNAMDLIAARDKCVELREKNIELTRLPTQSEIAALVAMKQQNAELLSIASRLAEWCEKYPPSRIYNESSIRKIAAEIDAIGADAREATLKAGVK